MDKWLDKLFNYHVPQFQDRDEYQQYLLYQIYAKTDILTSYILILFIIMAFIWDHYRGVQSIMPIILAVPIMVKSIYIESMMKKYQLIKVIYYNPVEYRQALMRLKHNAVISGIICFVMSLMTFNHFHFERAIPTSVVLTIFIVYSSYSYNRKNLKLIRGRRRE